VRARDERRLRKILIRMMAPAFDAETGPDLDCGPNYFGNAEPAQHLAYALLCAIDGDEHNALLSASGAIEAYRRDASETIRTAYQTIRMADEYGGEYGQPLPKDNPTRAKRASAEEREAAQ
jgi:hypothetical protein